MRIHLLGCVIFLTFFWVGTVDAQPVPVGEQFQVNTYTTNTQSKSSAAMQDSGDFVVAWTSYESGGSDTSGSSIRLRSFNADGSPSNGDETLVNTYTTSDQDEPFIAMGAGGEFIVVWESQGSPTDSSQTSIQFQRFNSNGLPQGSQTQVNTYTNDLQDFPSAVIQPNGDFVIVWESEGSAGTDASGRSIQARQFSSDGNALGDQFQVNTYTTGDQSRPAIAAKSDGDFIIAWGDAAPAGAGIQARRYSSNGSQVGTPFQITTGTANPAGNPEIAMAEQGEFVVLWQEYNFSGSGPLISIYGRRFNSDGTPDGANFQINNEPLGGITPSLAMAENGDFTVVWGDLNQPSPDPENIRVARYQSDGSLQGDLLQVNNLTGTGSFSPVVAINEAGSMVISWSSSISPGTDTDQTSVQARLFETPACPVPSRIDSPLSDGLLRLEEPPPLEAASTVDYDGDGDQELIYQDPGLSIGTAQGVDAGIDLNPEILLLGTENGGQVLGLFDFDFDGEQEVLMDDPTQTTGNIALLDRDLPIADDDPDVLLFGTAQGGTFQFFLDLDGDGEEEAVFEDPTLANGVSAFLDLEVPPDNDLDIFRLGTQGGGSIFGVFDFDGDGEEEILFLDLSLTTGNIDTLDIDLPGGDGDIDVVRLGILGGGSVEEAFDFDGDGENELVFLDPTLATGVIEALSVDPPATGDTDADILRFGVASGGALAELVDLDNDGEKEILFLDPTLANETQMVAGLDTPSDSDLDVLRIGTAGGGEVAAFVDFDCDGELEVLFEEPAIATGLSTNANIDPETLDDDTDLIRIGVQSGGSVEGFGDLDDDGEDEILFADPTLANGEEAFSSLDPVQDDDNDLIRIGVQSGGTLFGLADLDGDGEDELIFEDPTLATGSFENIDTNDPSDNDLDILRLGTLSGGTVIGVEDPDSDGDEEVIFEDPTQTSGTLTNVNIDAGPMETDFDLIRVGTQQGGRVVGTFDTEADGEFEIVFENPNSATGALTTSNLDSATDTDIDFVAVGTASGGGVEGLMDYDADDEFELLFNDPTLAVGEVQGTDFETTIDDLDVIRFGTNGGSLLGLSDPDGDLEMDLLTLDPANAAGWLATEDLAEPATGDGDPDALSIGVRGDTTFLGAADIDGDGEPELFFEEPGDDGNLETRDVTPASSDGDPDLFVLTPNVCTLPGVCGPIFDDGFESASSSAWSNTVP